MKTTASSLPVHTVAANVAPDKPHSRTSRLLVPRASRYAATVMIAMMTAPMP